jgi:predicted O-methyltransferase YrrM
MQRFNFIYSYFEYLLKSKTRFDIHSPFLFELIENVFKNKKDYIDYARVEELKSNLLQNDKKILVKDLGAGSIIDKGNERSVKQIARNSSKSLKYGRLMYRIAAYFKPKTMLELGTSLGLTTAYMAYGSPGSKIITIEGCPNIAREAHDNFKSLGLDNIEIITGNFDTELPGILNSVSNLELVFIDGNHRKDPTINYFKQCLSKVSNEMIIIFDDIHWSKEMEEAWREVSSHPAVTLSLDLFFMGFVFFRKELTEQHFIIRF